MINFEIVGNDILAIYSSEKPSDWVFSRIGVERDYAFNNTFCFNNIELLTTKADWELKLKERNKNLDLFGEEFPEIKFSFAKLKGDYYKVNKGILSNKFEIYLSKEIDINQEVFVFDGVSFFKAIEELVNEDIYIGGSNENALDIATQKRIHKKLPTPYEIKLYKNARITSIISESIKSAKDGEAKFEKYRNTKISTTGVNLLKTFQEYEIEKFTTIHEKLKSMLKDEDNYSENIWQDEILQIILLLYPKYIAVFKSVPIKAKLAEGVKDRFIDFLLVDANGNVDIVEIKKPFEKVIMSSNQYRNNYIPLKELSGTIMQIEKYVFYLNRWGNDGEIELTNKYKEKLPNGFDLKITNPNGIIIMGRENNLNTAQKNDFEVVKRKYKNIVDIITYDDLLERLRFTIERLKFF